MKIFNKFRGK